MLQQCPWEPFSLQILFAIYNLKWYNTAWYNTAWYQTDRGWTELAGASPRSFKKYMSCFRSIAKYFYFFLYLPQKLLQILNRKVYIYLNLISLMPMHAKNNLISHPSLIGFIKKASSGCMVHSLKINLLL